MTVISYKQVEIKHITISLPQKGEDGYSCKILYKNEPLIIQTPGLDFSETQTSFNMIDNGQFFSLFDNITEYFIENIFVNSKKFFNGKEFSEIRIRNSLNFPVNVGENGLVILNTFSTPNTKFINILNETTVKPCIPFSGKCIIIIDRIEFNKKDIKVIISIKSIKISSKKLSKKKDNILDFDEEIEEPIQEILEMEIENVDDLEFF